MVTSYKATNPPKTKATGKDTSSWFDTLIDLGSKGISERTIATRLGITHTELKALLEWQAPAGIRFKEGTYPVKEALALARAEFEISRVQIKDDILNNPNTSDSLKYKIAREDLKTLEEWAPAARTVSVTIEQAPTEFSFESYSDSEQKQIVAAAIASDTPIGSIAFDDGSKQ